MAEKQEMFEDFVLALEHVKNQRSGAPVVAPVVAHVVAPVVAPVVAKEEAPTWGLNRPFRSWEAAAAFVGLIVVIGSPLMSIRDTVTTIAANYVRREDIVPRKDYEALKATVDAQQSTLTRFDQVREQRNKEIDNITKHALDQDAQIATLRDQGTRIEGKIDTLSVSLANLAAKK